MQQGALYASGKIKSDQAQQRLFEEYRSQTLSQCRTNGYDNRSNYIMSTNVQHNGAVPVPVLKEYDYKGHNYAHKVECDFFGAKDSGLLAAFFHGGPGSGMAPKHRTYWDARQPNAKVRENNPATADYASSYLLFQQPAAKFVYDTQSYEPDANLQHLDTSLLVDSLAVTHDMLKTQGVQNEKMAVTGLSFGSTLSVLFAAKYPEKTEGLGLYGLFYGTEKDTNWIFQGAHEVYSPDFSVEFKNFSHHNGGDENNFVESFSYLFKHPDEQVRREAMYHFYKMELHTEEQIVLQPEEFDAWKNPDAPGVYEQKRLRAHTMIHFAENNFWLDPKDGIAPAIEKVAKADIPVVMGLSGKDFLLPPEKRRLGFVDNAFSMVKPENFSLLYDGDTAHLSTAQITKGNNTLRQRLMAKRGLHDRFNC